jgi:hypothetical protein
MPTLREALRQLGRNPRITDGTADWDASILERILNLTYQARLARWERISEDERKQVPHPLNELDRQAYLTAGGIFYVAADTFLENSPAFTPLEPRWVDPPPLPEWPIP